MKLRRIKLSDIHHVDNSRVTGFDHSELMESIKQSGLIQPIVVAKNFYTKGKTKPYVLVAGNRRAAAVGKLGEQMIDAVINEKIKTDIDLMIFNMSENLQRKAVSAFEQGRFIYKLHKTHKLTMKEIATRLGIPLHRVNALLDAFRYLPKGFAQQVVTDTSGTSVRGEIPLSTAREVCNLKKSNHINAAQASHILKNVSDNIYGANHVRRLAGEIRKGGSYEIAKRAEKTYSVINVKIPLLNVEKAEIEGGVQNYIEQIVYGETKDAFTRPRLA